MNRIDFVKSTVYQLDERFFSEVKAILIKEYINFSLINSKDVSREILCEKLCDYFEKMEFYTKKSFDKLIENYIENLDKIVNDRIEKTPKAKKNEPTPPTPRARKYYEYVQILKRTNISTNDLLDYSRIMLCLYTEIIQNKFNPISDFEYSSKCLNLPQIVNAMLNEKKSMLKKNLFDIKEHYSTDQFTFVVMIIMYYQIKIKEISGEC